MSERLRRCARGEIEFPQNGRFRNGSSSPPFSSPDSLKIFSSFPPLIFLQTGSFDLGTKEKANVIFMGGVGLGKTHLATALAYEACLAGYTALHATAIDIVNTLAAAQSTNRLKSELKKYLSPQILLVDELGYLPIDKTGADLLFQVLSQRYETGSTIVTTNQAYKNWAKIFNNDATLTSAVLDRLLHHAETITIEGKSYRMKDQIEDP